MRVLSFCSCYPSSVDPLRGIFVLRRLQALARHVHLEVVHPMPWFPMYARGLTAWPEEEEYVDGICTHHLRHFYIPRVFKCIDPAFYQRGVLPWVRRRLDADGAVDVLDAHFVWPDGVAVCRMGRLLGLPVVVTLRGSVNTKVHNAWMRPQIASALRYADGIISVSKPMADLAISLGAAPEKVHLIPNGVDLDCFTPLPAAQARRTLGLRGDRRYLVSVANLRPHKGLEETIDALSLLPLDVHLLLVGSGSSGYRRGLQQRARALGCGDRVTFAGSQNPGRVRLYLSASAVSVLASHSEGCPNVVLESLACGRPVVASAVGEIPRLLDSRSGMLVPPGDVPALAQTLRRALLCHWSPDEIRCSPAVQSWDCVARRVQTVFEQVLEARRGATSASLAALACRPA